MKKILLVLLLAIGVAFTSSAKDVKITIKVLPKAKSELGEFYLRVNETKTYVLIKDGVGQIEVDIEKNTFVYLSWMSSRISSLQNMMNEFMTYSMTKRTSFYLEPSKDLEISIDYDSIGFVYSANYEDDGINAYLNSLSFAMNRDMYKLGKKDFLKLIDKQQEKEYERLKKKCFSEEFTALQRENIRYQLAINILDWRYRQKDMSLEECRSILEPYLIKNETALCLYPYRFFSLEALQNVMPYVKGMSTVNRLHAKFEKIIEFDFGKYQSRILCKEALDYFDEGEITGSEELQKLLKDNMEDKKLLDQVFELIDTRSSLIKGAKSKSFTLEDINGEMVSLEDFKGKYVYIDLWASWCGPCKAEVPHLAKLEGDYHDNNVAFVSISTDANKKQWEKAVAKMSLGGTQLIVGEDQSFLNAYRVKGIPRFILIDPNGCIVDKNAPRPSSDKIRVLFDKLLK